MLQTRTPRMLGAEHHCIWQQYERTPADGKAVVEQGANDELVDPKGDIPWFYTHDPEIKGLLKRTSSG